MTESESKKRKRQSNGVGASNKRVAFDGEGSGLVKPRLSSGTGLHPVLVSSPGLTAPNTPFKAYAKAHSTKNSSHNSPKPSTHELLLHSSAHPRLDYSASQVTLDQHLSHYVGVFEPHSKQLQLIPAHHLSLRSSLRTETKEGEQDKQRRTIGQQRADLGREFGTKKTKKAIAAKTVNAIGTDDSGKGRKDAVQEAILESMADTVLPAPKEEERVEATLASKPIPRPNLAAESVEGVYTYDTLVPPAASRLVQVKEWEESTKAGKNLEFKHRFIAKRVSFLGKSDNTIRLKALRYLNLVLEFHDTLFQAGRSGKKVPKKEVLQRNLSQWPEKLIEHVRLRFSDERNELPQWHVQNLYTHICALSLYVDGWTTNTMDLKQDLRMENAEIVKYFRELGCQVGPPTEKERESQSMTKGVAAATRVARLKLPLDFPKTRTGRRI